MLFLFNTSSLWSHLVVSDLPTNAAPCTRYRQLVPVDITGVTGSQLAGCIQIHQQRPVQDRLTASVDLQTAAAALDSTWFNLLKTVSSWSSLTLKNTARLKTRAKLHVWTCNYSSMHWCKSIKQTTQTGVEHKGLQVSRGTTCSGQRKRGRSKINVVFRCVNWISGSAPKFNGFFLVYTTSLHQGSLILDGQRLWSPAKRQRDKQAEPIT